MCHKNICPRDSLIYVYMSLLPFCTHPYDVTYALDKMHKCDICFESISVKPHHYEEHNRALILMSMKNSTEFQQSIYCSFNKIIIIFNRTPTSVTYIPNASMMSLQRYFDEAYLHKVPMTHSFMLHHPHPCCTYPTCNDVANTTFPM